MPVPSNFFKKYISHLTDVPPALGFYWYVGQRTQALSLTWDQEWQLDQHISLGRGGREDLPQQGGPLYCRGFPLRACTEHHASISDWQRLLPPCSKRYWYRGQLYVWPNFKIMVPHTVVSHFYWPSKMCVYFCRAKKGVHIFFAQIFPPSASPLFFHKDN